MIVDSSAICAILLNEPDGPLYEDALAGADVLRMSALNVLETAFVMEGRVGPSGGDRLDTLIEQESIEIVPVTAKQVTAARRAWRRFGKGNHPAALNLGDCLAYALSEMTREPLLFKGEDFIRTDVQPA